MKKQTLTIHTNFEVREMRLLLHAVGLIFIFIFIYTIFNTKDISFQIIFFYGLMLLSPGILCIIKAIKNNLKILINKNGLYYYGKLITNWNNIITAYIREDPIFDRISDNFVLYVQFYNPNDASVYLKKIRMTSTQNKAEEEIIEAIQFFINHSSQMKKKL